MKEYLFEMHAHTSEVSRCAKVTGEELVRLYTSLGYDGVVVTNHVNTHSLCRSGRENLSWNEKIDFFLDGFNKVKEAADGKLTVLLGMEISFYTDPNDYLVYGVNEDFLRNNGDLMAMSREDFSILAHENGMLFIQAHPFRRDSEIVNWEILDGYEIFNGNPRHISSNEITEVWAKLHGKNIVTSGSDFHEIEDAGRGGMYFNTPITSNDDLLRELKSLKFRLKRK